MRILVLTYTYPPSNSVNGFRPYYFAQTLQEAGHEITVLTRHFTGFESHTTVHDENHTPVQFRNENGLQVIRIPHKNSWFTYFKNKWIRNTGIWKIIYFFQLLLGRTCQESYNTYFKRYLPDVLNKICPDLVLVESGPTNLVRLASKECLIRKIKYIIDFRDLYYHEMYLKDISIVSWRKKLKLYLEKFYMQQAIKNACKIISISEKLHEILGSPTFKRVNILNGYDENAWAASPHVRMENVFKIGVCGTLYPFDFLNTFLESFKLFFRQNPDRVQLVFLAPGGNDMCKRIIEYLPFPNVQVINQRVSYLESIQFMKSCTILAYHGWPGYKGYISAKLYEYLRSEKKILIVPGDQDSIDDLLKETNVGLSYSNSESAANQLDQWYAEWNKGSITSNTQLDLITKYSRQTQNKKLVSLVAEFEK